MKTAVEWLLENLISEPHSEEDFKYNSKCWDKAKEIEKEQIVKAHFDGCEIGEIFAYENREFITDSEQYYSKTFKQSRREKHTLRVSTLLIALRVRHWAGHSSRMVFAMLSL
jgi:hypothetical protein